MQRGEIKYRDRAKQLRDFSGLQFGNITPTDIDGYLEFKDLLYVWIEAKSAGCKMPYGQKLALARMCRVIDGTTNENGQIRTAVVIVVEHDTPVDEDVNYAQTSVSTMLYGGEWTEPRAPINLRRAIEILLERHTFLKY